MQFGTAKLFRRQSPHIEQRTRIGQLEAIVGHVGKVGHQRPQQFFRLVDLGKRAAFGPRGFAITLREQVAIARILRIFVDELFEKDDCPFEFLRITATRRATGFLSRRLIFGRRRPVSGPVSVGWWPWWTRAAFRNAGIRNPIRPTAQEKIGASQFESLFRPAPRIRARRFFQDREGSPMRVLRFFDLGSAAVNRPQLILHPSDVESRLVGRVGLAQCGVFLECQKISRFGPLVVAESLIDVSQTTAGLRRLGAQADARSSGRAKLVIDVAQILEEGRRFGRDDRLRAC